MSSWRIETRFDNRSGKSLASSGGGVGGTVVRAPRGTAEPIYFSKGETLRMIELLGKPSSDYPDLLEALYYVDYYPMWVSAPSVNGRYGGVALTPTGVAALPAGTLNQTISFSSLQIVTSLATGDASSTTFSKTLPSSDYYVHQSIDILVNGVSIDVTASDVSTEVLTSDDGSGTYDRTTGEVEFTFDSAPADEDNIEVVYQINVSSEYYAILLAKAPTADYLAIKATYNSDDSTYEISLYEKGTDGSYTLKDGYPITVSLDPEAEDGYGDNIYIENVLDNDDYMVAFVNSDLSYTSFTDSTTYTDFNGGDRGDTVSGADLAAGYDYFQKARKYAVDVFFDPTNDSTIPAKYTSLRNSYQTTSRYILSMGSLDYDAAIAAGVPVDNIGVSVYWNRGKVENYYATTGPVWTNLLGEVAQKHADIITGAFGGIAPAWIDENGWGGQLSSGRIIEMEYDPDETQLEALDEARINAIIDHPNYGPMITSRRTTASTLSDYSFIDNVGARDYIVRNIQNNVLPYQIVKMNDDVHRTIVRNKCDTIIAPMTVAPRNVIRAYAIKCDEENNNDDVLNEEKFVLQVAVKFTPKSRTIIFTFINTSQSSSVDEAFS